MNQVDPHDDRAGRVATRTAGVIIIGDEILSARFADRNTAVILERMAWHGIRVGEVAMLADDVARIAAVVADFAGRFDLVITTGGVGPTHDDRTWPAIALAFGRDLVVHDEMLHGIEQRIGRPLTEEQRRMVILPAGTRLMKSGDGYVLHIDHVYVLPGVPSMVAERIEAICAAFAGPRPWLATVCLDVHEWRHVDALDRIVAACPGVAIGSYPILDQRTDHDWRLTFEAAARETIEAAIEMLIEAVDAAHLVRLQWRAADVDGSRDALTTSMRGEHGGEHGGKHGGKPWPP